MLDRVKEIFDLCLRRGEFPKEWKRGSLVLIPKSSPPGAPKKYRPICLLGEVGKCLERIVTEMMWAHLEAAGPPTAAISPNQYGFRKGCSTVNVIRQVVEYI